MGLPGVPAAMPATAGELNVCSSSALAWLSVGNLGFDRQISYVLGFRRDIKKSTTFQNRVLSKLEYAH